MAKPKKIRREIKAGKQTGRVRCRISIYKPVPRSSAQANSLPSPRSLPRFVGQTNQSLVSTPAPINIEVARRHSHPVHPLTKRESWNQNPAILSTIRNCAGKPSLAVRETHLRPWSPYVRIVVAHRSPADKLNALVTLQHRTVNARAIVNLKLRELARSPQPYSRQTHPSHGRNRIRSLIHKSCG